MIDSDGIGDAEPKADKWARVCNPDQRYWLDVVYDGASAHPQLLRIRDLLRMLIVKAKGGVVIHEHVIFEAAEEIS